MRNLTYIFLLISISSIAQELSFYRSYLVIPEIQNPAYNGVFDCTRYSLTAKQQWLGIEDAPGQQIAAANIRFEKSKFSRHGFGAMLLNDMNGPTRATGLELAYARHFMVNRSKGRWLSLGLGATGLYKYLLEDEFVANTTVDPLFGSNNIKALNVDLTGGIVFYSKKFQTGLSFLQILQNKHFADENTRVALLIIANGQYHFSLSKTIKIIPGILMRYEHKNHLTGDINIKAETDKFWFCLSLRSYFGNYENTINSLLLNLGYTYKKFIISYSADIGFTGLQTENLLGHELSIGIKLCKEDCGCTD